MSEAAIEGVKTERRQRLGAGLMALAGLALIISNIQFFFKNFSDDFLEQGITIAEVGVTKTEIGAFSSDLLNYISHLHIAISGLSIGLGIGVAAMAWLGVRRGSKWAWWTSLATISVAGAIALPAHFVWGFGTVGHLGPTAVVVLIFVTGAVLSYRSSNTAD